MTQYKGTVLINTHNMGASPPCFGTTLPSSEGTNGQLLKPNCHWKAAFSGNLGLKLVLFHPEDGIVVQKHGGEASLIYVLNTRCDKRNGVL